MMFLNVNGLLSRTDELRDTTNDLKPATLDTAESKQDCSITNMK